MADENITTDNTTTKYVQKILFGSPGTGKSYKILDGGSSIKNGLNIESNENIFRTIFHPEYKYGDFMGKLLPHTEGGGITYKFYSGIFLKALAKAYRNFLDGNKENVLLIVDEINRGNTAAIFGTVFQLLDRNEDGWSSYEVNVSDLEFNALLNAMDIAKTSKTTFAKCSDDAEVVLPEDLKFLLNGEIKIPQNLSIVGTMNTSDESIYYMDSAFKRRWEWEYIPVDGGIAPKIGEISLQDLKISDWDVSYKNINDFILENDKYVRKVEDKLIGKWFLKENERDLKSVQNKLMFFLWDTVFQRDKTPLEELLNKGIKEEDKVTLKTFGDFADHVGDFLKKRNINYDTAQQKQDDPQN
ncbi:AAA family ATPase [Sulfurimonas sp. NW15]|uniref:AAA family ATPase n=1 Tax=Sulfurimonas sp. NW15 TaxID=2922729 RepID=UPI003DA93EFD